MDPPKNTIDKNQNAMGLVHSNVAEYVQKKESTTAQVFLNGPVSLTAMEGEDSDGNPMYVYIAGDFHVRKTMCAPAKARRIWSLIEFLSELHKSIPDEIMDVHLEHLLPAGANFWHGAELANDESYIVDFFKSLGPCIFSRDEFKRTHCLVNNMKFRIHQSDVRTVLYSDSEKRNTASLIYQYATAMLIDIQRQLERTETGKEQEKESVWLERRIKELFPMERTATSPEFFISKLESLLSMYKGLDGKQLTIEDAFYSINAKIDKQLRKVSEQEQKVLNRRPLYKTLAAWPLEVVVNLAKTTMDEFIHKKQISEVSRFNLRLLVNLGIEAMDVYLLARMFKRPSNKYVFIYAGETHAQNYIKTLTELDFVTKFSSSPQTLNYKHMMQCIDISDMRWPFFGVTDEVKEPQTEKQIPKGQILVEPSKPPARIPIVQSQALLRALTFSPSLVLAAQPQKKHVTQVEARKAGGGVLAYRF